MLLLSKPLYTQRLQIYRSILSHDFSAHTDLQLDMLSTGFLNVALSRIILDKCNIKIFVMVK